MSWISEAHAQWHMVHGQMEVCPLDCGVGEVNDYDPEDDADYTPSPEVQADWERYTGDPWAVAPF